MNNADIDKLEKILANFLSNALKFTPEGGEVRCQVLGVRSQDYDLGRQGGGKERSLTKLTPETSLLITISDTGPGLPPEDLERVFDRFYQSSTTDQASGTGIGLSLAKELAVLIGGRVWAKSELGKGATFAVEVPLIKVEDQTLTVVEAIEEEPIPVKVEMPAANGHEKKATILLAEDHPDMQHYIREVLSDYKVITASNGAEALQILKTSNPPDLILSDIMMPVMDGMELLSRLKADSQPRRRQGDDND